MRLDKFLSQQLEISRSLVARELHAERVTVDGEVVKSGAFKLSPEHQVEFDGEPLKQQNGALFHVE